MNAVVNTLRTDPAWSRWLLAVGLLACAFYLTRSIQFDVASHLPDDTVQIDQAYFLSGAGRYSLDDADYGTLETLPHIWATSSRDHVGWYTALVELNLPNDQVWAFYFPDITIDSTVFINGRALGPVLGVADDSGLHGRRPLFQTIPASMLEAGENEIRIRVNAEPRERELMRPFHIGPEYLLADVYRAHLFSQVTILKVIAVVLLVAFLSMSLIWIYKPRETRYGWFALVCLLWAMHCLNVVYRLPLPGESSVRSGDMLPALLLMATLLLFVLRYRQMSTRRTRQWLALLLPVCLLFAFGYIPGVTEREAALVSGVAALMLATAALLVVCAPGQRDRRRDAYPLIAVLAGIVVFTFRECQVLLYWPETAYQAGSLALGAPLFVLLAGWQLIRDFVRSSNALEDLNRHLEQRVAERTLQLEQTHQQVLQMEKQQLLTRERDRIMQEMHDGMGAHLVSAMSVLEKDKVNPLDARSILEEALNDLRLMVDSLDCVDGDLAMVLGMYRQRLNRILEGTQVSLDWQVSDVPHLETLSAGMVLQVLRIVQEAVSNALKYAGASRLRIRTQYADDRIELLVDDNGCGFGADCLKGRGIDNMRRRAAQIGARLSIDTSPGQGVTVTLAIPRESTFSLDSEEPLEAVPMSPPVGRLATGSEAAYC